MVVETNKVGVSIDHDRTIESRMQTATDVVSRGGTCQRNLERAVGNFMHKLNRVEIDFGHEVKQLAGAAPNENLDSPCRWQSRTVRMKEEKYLPVQTKLKA